MPPKKPDATWRSEYFTPFKTKIKGMPKAGTKNGNARLTEAQVYSIRLMLQKHNPPSLQEIADHFGISRQHVGRIKAGKTWDHLTSWVPRKQHSQIAKDMQDFYLKEDNDLEKSPHSVQLDQLEQVIAYFIIQSTAGRLNVAEKERVFALINSLKANA